MITFKIKYKPDIGNAPKSNPYKVMKSRTSIGKYHIFDKTKEEIREYFLKNNCIEDVVFGNYKDTIELSFEDKGKIITK